MPARSDIGPETGGFVTGGAPDPLVSADGARLDPSLSQGIGTLEDVETWQEHPRSATPGNQAGAELTSVRFAEAARQLGRAAAGLGLTAPAFRSPPKRRGLQRSITRRSDGSATVSVAIRDRPAVAVVADMIDGVVAANRVGPSRSAKVRDQLWAAASPCLSASPDRAGVPRGPRSRPVVASSAVDGASPPRVDSSERRAA